MGARGISCDDLVSIIIPTRNRADTASIALHTALHQSHSNIEVIVVDDGSEIPFDQYVRDERVRVIRLDRQCGVAHCRNLGMMESRGNYIAFLDDDDWYYPDKIAHQLAFLRQHEEIDGVFSRVVVIDSQGKERRYLPEAYRHTNRLNFRYFNVIHTNSALLRRRIYPAVTWDERLLKYTDMQFFLELTRQFKLAYLNEDVAVWYKQDRADQLTSQQAKSAAAKNHQNFQLICEIFHNTISESLELRLRYYGRLFIAGLKARSWLSTCAAAWVLLTGRPASVKKVVAPG
jgi:glycosyltransferase involved in cell wall biosynthesis